MQNTGKWAVGDVVVAFASRVGGAPTEFGVLPAEWMVTFGRTRRLAPGKTTVLQLNLTARDLALVDRTGSEVIVAGTFSLRIYDGSTTLRCVAHVPKTQVISTLPSPKHDDI